MTTETTTERKVNRKSRVGTVVSDKQDKTIVVEIERAAQHRIYHKVIRLTKKYHVHDEHNQATLGDLVRIEECRPISKLKRWQLVAVLTEREVAEVSAESLDQTLVEEMQRSGARRAEEETAAGEASAAPAADAASSEGEQASQ